MTLIRTINNMDLLFYAIKKKNIFIIVKFIFGNSIRKVAFNANVNLDFLFVFPFRNISVKPNDSLLKNHIKFSSSWITKTTSLFVI